MISCSFFFSAFLDVEVFSLLIVIVFPRWKHRVLEPNLVIIVGVVDDGEKEAQS